MHDLGYVSERARRLREAVSACQEAWDANATGPAITDRLEDVATHANHLAKALRLPNVPAEFSAGLDDNLEERITRTRNLWEHWEEEGDAADWFDRKHAGKRNVLATDDDVPGQVRIAGIYSLDELRTVLEVVADEFTALRARGGLESLERNRPRPGET